MKDEIIEAYLKEKESGATEFWPKLMKQFGFIKKEKIRSIVRRGLKERGVKVETEGEVVEIRTDRPRILILDIETLPINCLVFGLHDQYLTPANVLRDWTLLSWSAKWLLHTEIMSEVLNPKEAKEGNDARLVMGIWKLLNEADITVTYNGNSFDLKKLNTKFLMYGMNPPSKYTSVDTYQTIRNTFSFSSNKLDSVNELLELDRKIETNFDLWKRCFYGEEEALHEMLVYNRHDVEILEPHYLKLLPWIKNHPNVAVYSDVEEEMCPKCGNTDLEWSGYSYTSTGKFSAFRCSKCGSIGKSKVNEFEKDKKATLLTQG
jgi:DNA polymerase elongation subunit (family B)